MTQDHLLDMVEKQFPEVRETEARVHLNNAVKEFCERTRLVRGVLTITSVADTTDYALDTRILEVHSVYVGTDVYTRLAQPVEQSKGSSEKAYYVTGGRLHIGTLGDKVLAAMDAGSTINMRVTYIPADLTEFVQFYDSAGDAVVDKNGQNVFVVGDILAEGPGIPEQFHMAAVYGAYRELYPQHTDGIEGLRRASFYNRRFEDLVHQGRAFAERNYSSNRWELTRERF